ncbi:MAG: NUDIX domain-containing protein [Ignavibacteria bacterium]|jgi:dATP pyrophosphohydrolase|nr:NUDIX domain-containing protein [Ignavibacteria bacterium]
MTTTFAVRIVQVHIAKRDTGSDDWQFLALRRAASETVFPNVWQPVTGSIEEGETPQDAAFRELAEETGLHAKELWVLPFVAQYFDAMRNTMNFLPCFGAIVSAESAVTISHEHSEYEWLRLADLRTRFAIPSHSEAGEHFHRHILVPLDEGIAPVFARCYRNAPIS